MYKQADLVEMRTKDCIILTYSNDTGTLALYSEVFVDTAEIGHFKVAPFRRPKYRGADEEVSEPEPLPIPAVPEDEPVPDLHVDVGLGSLLPVVSGFGTIFSGFDMFASCRAKAATEVPPHEKIARLQARQEVRRERIDSELF